MSSFPITRSQTTPATTKSSRSSGNPRLKNSASRRPCRNPSPEPSPAALKGVEEDFAKLYQSYRRRVLSHCYGMLRNHTDAEDAAQEVFLRVFLKAHTFRGDSSFSTWLYRLTTNCVLMEMRKKRCRGLDTAAREPGDDSEYQSAHWDPAFDRLRAPEGSVFERVSIGVAMSRLPLGYQEVFDLHDVQGHTHREIARILGIHVGTSKSQLYKARLRLRRILQSQAPSVKEV